MPKKKSHKATVVTSSDTINNIKTSNDFFIVGIGASAGGLAAFESFFSSMPADSSIDMAFVLVQHLAPDHKSMLTELIQRYTSMKVYEVEDGMRVQPNRVYIIPPNHNIALFEGMLQVLEFTAPRGQRLPIDFFFRSLAKDQHEHAIGIILSGTGHDGTGGIKAIKEEGGTVIAQSIDSAQFDGMPSSTIATGLVDYVLPPNEMPTQLIAYTSHVYKNREFIPHISKNENILKKIFILLNSQTSHDFSMYKPSTMGRRIERRMAIHLIETIEDYYKYLQQSEDEVKALLNDFLIGVTNFFRDPEAFASLEKVAIPKVFSGKVPGAPIRIWVAGCSTGEEAYSIAILVMEYMEELKQSYAVQIFATDIDTVAIATARAGIYPVGIETNISKERLERYFIKSSDEGSYRIHGKIRDMLVFSMHNVIKDPPFSKLDLISCRNLLIYMNVKLQQKLISLFHYALNADGILFLGTSETVGGLSDLFKVLDQKSKLYQSKKNSTNMLRTTLSNLLSVDETYLSQHINNKVDFPAKLPLRELTEQAILEQIAPAAALINEGGDILYLHGHTGMYLELPSGETGVNNILKMAREGLKNDLILALHKAKTNKQTVQIKGLRVKTNSHFTIVNFTICLVAWGTILKPKSPLFLVIFEDYPSADQKHISNNFSSLDQNTDRVKSDEDPYVQALKEELRLQKKFLQDANERLEAFNQELKSYNEEIQSMNEELQSTNEELETSKEELQSVNEELSTVNTELNTKVNDLSRLNNDMNNLLAGTGIGSIFVDYELCILRFTPAVTEIINLIPGDLGRPIGHIASNLLGYDNFVADIQSVLDTLQPKEIEVKTKEDKWFSMRMQPYRTLENAIKGVVISFVDITEIVTMREELRNANMLSRLAIIVRDSSDAITVYDMNGKIIAWNPGAERMYGWSEVEALKMNIKDRIPKALQSEDFHKLKQLSNSEILESYKTQRINKEGAIIDISITSTALIDTSGETYAIATIERIPMEKGRK